MNKKPIEILLVEDNPGDITLLNEFMKKSSIANNVSSVENGVEALAFLYREGKYKNAPRPDFILLDLNMPKMGGREVLATIKEDHSLKTIPVIVLTTSTAPSDIQNAYLLHANCYLSKPADLDQLYNVVKLIEDFWMKHAQLPSIRH